MNLSMIRYILGSVLAVEGLLMLPCGLVGYCYGEHAQASIYMIIGCTILLLGLMFRWKKPANAVFYLKEGCVSTALCWIVMSILGGLPFLLTGEIGSFTDAMFETVSGFTTTGASILSDVEAMSHVSLFWRSFTHWVGGMGVLVFLLAIAPGQDKGFTMHLMRAESPGPDVGKLVPRMKDTAKILYAIYIVLTVLCFIFLLFGGMNWLEALCTAFGTAGTGGFGVRNDSMASFNAYTQIVTTVFMFLFGINFSCYYLILLKKIKGVFFDEELRLYVFLAAASIGLIAWNIYGIYGNLADTLRHSAFQVSTVMTTTGFSTADFDQWPAFSKGILLMLMMVGACAGSTGGGFKCGRLLLVLKSLGRNIRKILNPQKVQVIRNNGKVVSEDILDNTNAYLAAYVIIVVACFVLISLDGFSVETNFSATLACFNNIGPGFAAVGPMCNYSAYSAFSKILLSIAMLAGRLEIFPILVLFSRSTWTRR